MVVTTSTRPLETDAAAADCCGVRLSCCGAVVGGAPGRTPEGPLGAGLASGGRREWGAGARWGGSASRSRWAWVARPRCSRGSAGCWRAPAHRAAGRPPPPRRARLEPGGAPRPGPRAVARVPWAAGSRAAHSPRPCRVATTGATSTGRAHPTAGRPGPDGHLDPGRPDPTCATSSLVWTATAAEPHTVWSTRT